MWKSLTKPWFLRGCLRTGEGKHYVSISVFQNLKPDTSADRWHSSRSSHRATFGSLPLPKGPITRPQLDSMSPVSLPGLRSTDLPICQLETIWNKQMEQLGSSFRWKFAISLGRIETVQWFSHRPVGMWLGCNGLVWRIIIFLWTSYIIGSPACGWSCVECEPSHLRGKHGKNGMGSTHTLGFGWVSPRCLTGGWTPQAPLYENMQRLILDYLSWDNLTQSLENWGSHQKRMNHCFGYACHQGNNNSQWAAWATSSFKAPTGLSDLSTKALAAWGSPIFQHCQSLIPSRCVFFFVFVQVSLYPWFPSYSKRLKSSSVLILGWSSATSVKLEEKIISSLPSTTIQKLWWNHCRSPRIQATLKNLTIILIRLI